MISAVGKIFVCICVVFFNLGLFAGASQAWDDQWLKIANRGWSMCLNLRDQGAFNGGFPDVFGCVEHPDQEWWIEDIGGGWYKIRNRSWNMCLNLQPHEAYNGGRPNVWACEPHPDQEWRVEDIGGGWFKIRNRAHNMCLNLQQHGAYDGGQPNVWACETHPDQEWQFFTLPSGWSGNIAAEAEPSPAAPGPAQGFVNGRWLFEGYWGSVGANCVDSGDAPFANFSGTGVGFYESYCDFLSIEPQGNPALSWIIQSSCGGEGETWHSTMQVDFFDTAVGRRLNVNFLNGSPVLQMEPC